MLLKRVNNLFVILIILCSTGFFNLTMLGSGQKAAELMGAGMIVALLAIHYTYSDQLTFKKNFVPFILLIFLSAVYKHDYSKLCEGTDIRRIVAMPKGLFFTTFSISCCTS